MNRSKSKHIFLRGYLIYRLVVLVCFFCQISNDDPKCAPYFSRGNHSPVTVCKKYARCLGDFPIFEGDGHPPVFRGLYIYISSSKLTQTLPDRGWKTNFHYKLVIFRVYVNLPVGNVYVTVNTVDVMGSQRRDAHAGDPPPQFHNLNVNMLNPSRIVSSMQAVDGCSLERLGN